MLRSCSDRTDRGLARNVGLNLDRHQHSSETAAAHDRITVGSAIGKAVDERSEVVGFFTGARTRVNIDGEDLDWAPMDAAYNSLSSGFVVGELERAFLAQGVDPAKVGRAAARYLQSMRKHGRALYVRKAWLKLREHGEPRLQI